MEKWEQTILQKLKLRDVQFRPIENIIKEFARIKEFSLPNKSIPNMDMVLLKKKIKVMENKISVISKEKELLVSQKHGLEDKIETLEENLKVVQDSETEYIKQIEEHKDETERTINGLLQEIETRDRELATLHDTNEELLKESNEFRLQSMHFEKQHEIQEQIIKDLSTSQFVDKQNTRNSGFFSKFIRKKNTNFMDEMSDTASSTSSYTPTSEVSPSPKFQKKFNQLRIQTMGTQSREPEEENEPYTPPPMIYHPPYRSIQNNIQFPKDSMYCLQLLDRDYVMFGGKDEQLHILNYIELTSYITTQTIVPKQISTIKIGPPECNIKHIAIHPNKEFAIFTGSQGMIQKLDITKPENLENIKPQPLEGWYSSKSVIMGTTFFCKQFVTVSYDGILKFWDEESLDVIDVVRSPSPVLCIHSSQHCIYIGCLDGSLYMCDTFLDSNELELLKNFGCPIFSIDLSPDNDKLLLTLGNHSVALLQHNNIDGRSIFFKHDHLKIHHYSKAKFSGCGNFVYIGSDHSIFLWDVNQHRDNIIPYSCGDNEVLNVIWTPTYLIAITKQGKLFIFK